MNFIFKNKLANFFEERSKIIFWIALFVYIFIVLFTMCHHEPWGDELHAWGIAKNSIGLSDLIYNSRYEGHPPVWFIILWFISKFTHDFLFVQLAHVLIAIAVVVILLFYSPFPKITKLLLPFGYYFLYEYAVLSRNYMVGLLLCFLLCIIIRKEFKHKMVLYYALLLLMSNTHLLALLLAGSIHLYFLLSLIERKAKWHNIFMQLILAMVIFLPAVIFILPPADSAIGLNAAFDQWSVGQLAISVQAPLRALVPMPAWWEYHFWNNQFLLSLHNKYSILKIVYPTVSLALVLLCCYILKNNRKSMVLFLSNIAMICVVGNVHIIATQRYAGFVFTGFIVAYWLHCYEGPISKGRKKIIHALLVLQLMAAVFSIGRDIRFPFSNANKVGALVNDVPEKERLVTDCWSMVAYTAYIDKPIYCIDMEQTMSFNLWQTKVTEMLLRPDRYYHGLKNLFQKEHLGSVYLLTFNDPAKLSAIDPKLFSAYKVHLVDKADDSIEHNSNLFLYQISELGEPSL